MFKQFRHLGVGIVAVILLLTAAFANVPATRAQDFGCYGAAAPRLQIGGQGRVTPGLPNIFRSKPYRGYDSYVLGQIPAGSSFSVIGGPSCFDSMLWWQVNWNGQIGWTPEASNYGVYWTEPISVNNGDCMSVSSRLSAGGYARVTPGLPNVLRSQPNRRAGSMILANLPAGSIFSVVGTPICAEGMIWWQINWNGLSGWTAEGQYSTYWLEPYGQTYPPPPTGCNTTRNPPVTIGYTGVVAPGAPNNLRAQASLSAQVLASMSAGESFMVLSNPVCANGLIWWPVNYRGMSGWTVEGQNGQTWINMLACPGFKPSQVSVGRYARVTPGLPNRLRSTASTNSLALALIPAGGTVSVIGGAVCAENSTWWRVNYQGIIGWTMEGQWNDTWLTPVS
ncbi:MAG: SH3 domain-containing protein [Chloroflexi bacterium]|nr:SH3 domain-containing protein [Chloroflexota bacterium]